MAATNVVNLDDWRPKPPAAKPTPAEQAKLEHDRLMSEVVASFMRLEEHGRRWPETVRPPPQR